MKKFVSVVVVLLLAAGISAPYVSGMIAEKQLRALTEKCNTMYKEATLGASLEIVRYDRSYSSSEVDWKYNLGPLSSLYGTQEILFHDTVKHGLTGVVAETTLMNNPKYAEFVKTKLAGKDPLHITTQYSLMGNSAITTKLDPFSLDVAGKTLQIKPAHVVMNVDKELKHFTYEGSWDGMGVDDQAALEGVSLQADMRMESIYLWNGFGTMVAEGGWIKDGNKPFSFANFKFNYVSDYSKENDRFSTKMEYSTDSIDAGGEKIDNAFVGLALNNINASAYEELLVMYMQAFNRALTSLGANGQDPKEVEKALEKEMKTIGMQLLGPAEKMMAKGLELQVSDLHFTLPQGKVTGDISVGLKKDMTLAQFMPLSQDPTLAFDIFSLQSHCSLPKALLAGKPELFQPMTGGMQTGIFVEQGEQAQHVAEIKDGKLLLNGKEVQL
ncbi:DUF945 family protein [Desulfobulbus rhabdoformis]|uniref:DUF945 family protein n=1 Tax=Desulfobulbus rhabdoformis TaxID=34032 RepID=UPI0019665D07|nr:DUF945 family protein [Desulfobulbus rhabdoformis]MBM9615651.1 DUF945 family protein [Desulfobulbus rhabdoformis]